MPRGLRQLRHRGSGSGGRKTSRDRGWSGEVRRSPGHGRITSHRRGRRRRNATLCPDAVQNVAPARRTGRNATFLALARPGSANAAVDVDAGRSDRRAAADERPRDSHLEQLGDQRGRPRRAARVDRAIGGRAADRPRDRVRKPLRARVVVVEPGRARRSGRAGGARGSAARSGSRAGARRTAAAPRRAPSSSSARPGRPRRRRPRGGGKLVDVAAHLEPVGARQARRVDPRPGDGDRRADRGRARARAASASITRCSSGAPTPEPPTETMQSGSSP